MTLASVRSEAHAFLSPTDHRRHEPRSQHSLFRTTILRLNLYCSHHQYLTEQKFPSFCQQTSIHNHCYQNFWKLVKPSQQKKPKSNQQLDISTNPFVFDTIQTNGLNPNAARDITLLSAKQPIDVSFEVDVNSNKKFNDLPKLQSSTATSTTFDTKQHKTNIQNIKPTKS